MYDRRNDGESTGGTQRTGRIVLKVEEKECLEMASLFSSSADFCCDFNLNTSKLHSILYCASP